MLNDVTAQPTPFAGKRQQLLISIRDTYQAVSRLSEDVDGFNGSADLDATVVARLETFKEELRTMAGTVVIG
jgi:hypothetical protein